MAVQLKGTPAGKRRRVLPTLRSRGGGGAVLVCMLPTPVVVAGLCLLGVWGSLSRKQASKHRSSSSSSTGSVFVLAQGALQHARHAHCSGATSCWSAFSQLKAAAVQLAGRPCACTVLSRAAQDWLCKQYCTARRPHLSWQVDATNLRFGLAAAQQCCDCDTA